MTITVNGQEGCTCSACGTFIAYPASPSNCPQCAQVKYGRELAEAQRDAAAEIRKQNERMLEQRFQNNYPVNNSLDDLAPWAKDWIRNNPLPPGPQPVVYVQPSGGNILSRLWSSFVFAVAAAACWLVPAITPPLFNTTYFLPYEKLMEQVVCYPLAVLLVIFAIISLFKD